MNCSETEIQPPSWLRWLGNDAARAFRHADDPSPPIGCHFHLDVLEDVWEVTVFPASTEVVGGPLDGTMAPARFQLDINLLAALFDQPPGIHWQSGSFGEDDELCDHVALEGKYRAREVWLRILRVAPAQAGPGRVLDAQSGDLRVLWDSEA